MEVSENLDESVLHNSSFSTPFYERINKFLDDHNLYAIEDPLAFSQSSTFSKKVSLFKFQISLQGSQSSLHILANQSPKSKGMTLKPSILISNFGELALGSVKSSSLIQKRKMMQKANSCPENSHIENFRLSMPSLNIGKYEDDNSLKEIAINKISYNSFPGLNMKNTYLTEENNIISKFS